jgi:hypothetical protein
LSLISDNLDRDARATLSWRDPSVIDDARRAGRGS